MYGGTTLEYVLREELYFLISDMNRKLEAAKDVEEKEKLEDGVILLIDEYDNLFHNFSKDEATTK